MNYNIFSKNKVLLDQAESLTDAMEKAKRFNEFVTITDGVIEVNGIFGVDCVQNGKTPDGVDYTWDKSDRIGKLRNKDKSPQIDTFSEENWDD